MCKMEKKEKAVVTQHPIELLILTIAEYSPTCDLSTLLIIFLISHLANDMLKKY